MKRRKMELLPTLGPEVCEWLETVYGLVLDDERTALLYRALEDVHTQEKAR